MSKQMSLFVGRLNPTVQQQELYDLFGTYGSLKRCELKGTYAFVTFDDEKNAENAKRALQGYELHGSRINVEWAKASSKGMSERQPDTRQQREDVCYECGERGHFARECRLRQGRPSPPPRPRSRSPPRRPRSRSPSPRRWRSRSRSPPPPRRRRRERSMSLSPKKPERSATPPPPTRKREREESPNTATDAPPSPKRLRIDSASAPTQPTPNPDMTSTSSSVSELPLPLPTSLQTSPQPLNDTNGPSDVPTV